MCLLWETYSSHLGNLCGHVKHPVLYQGVSKWCENSSICTRKAVWALFLSLSHPLMICLPQNEFIVGQKPRWAFSVCQNFPFQCLSSTTIHIHRFYFPAFKASYHGQSGSTEIQTIYMERKKIPCLHSRPGSALHFHAPRWIHPWWGLSSSSLREDQCHNPCPCTYGQGCTMDRYPIQVPPGRGSQLGPGHSTGLHHSKSWEWVLLLPVLSPHNPQMCFSCRRVFLTGNHSAYKLQTSFWICCHSWKISWKQDGS